MQVRTNSKSLQLTGIQFLLWTISGLYFSWTNIDEIHGDHLRNQELVPAAFDNLLSPTDLTNQDKTTSIALKDIAGEPYYWINEKQLVNARTGEAKQEITKEEALQISKINMKPGLKVATINRIENVDAHSEYRGKPLPAYAISYESSENVIAYVSVKDGQFQTLRHRDWRWFDFLWMSHTMDYQGRDNFNTIVLRVFSLLGLITVLSGFTLWFTSSPTIRKLGKKKK